MLDQPLAILHLVKPVITGDWSPYQSLEAPCGLRGCKNGPAPFPGQMSYKATKPGLVCLSYLSMLYYYIVVYYGPFLCSVSFRCCVFCLLVVLAKLSVLAK